jgi:CheY-like chemotaxis protein/HPt (histidine-containing phosphotransfer) domain-containing protein
VVAGNGQEAVNAITGGAQVDLILMDVQMPVMDGYTATAWIRHREAELALPHLPIIALTADAFEEDRQRCLAAGMDDFLTKPVNVAKLSAALARWLPGEQADQLAEPVVAALESAAVYKNTAVFTEPQEPRIAAPTSDLPIFDEKTLLMQLGDDRELCCVVLPSAANDIVNYLDQLDQAIADDNLKDALRLLHSLKGLAAQIGGSRLANEFKTAEVRLKSGHFPELADMTALRIEYQTFLDELPAWLRSSVD